MKINDIPELVERLRTHDDLPDCDVEIQFDCCREIDDFGVRLVRFGLDKSSSTCWYGFSSHNIEQAINHLVWAYADNRGASPA